MAFAGRESSLDNVVQNTFYRILKIFIKKKFENTSHQKKYRNTKISYKIFLLQY